MGGFANSVLGGASKLIRKAIQSPNYVPGSAGWSVNKDGSAEFSNLTLRGNLVVQSGSQGVFVYSGTPALGNLIASIASAAGTDPYGNAYLSGFVSYNAGYSAKLFQAEFSVHNSGFTADGQLYGNEFGSASVGPSMVLRSPSDFTSGQHISTVLVYGMSQDGTWPSQIQLTGWTDASLTTKEPTTVNVNGSLLVSNGIGEEVAKYKANHTGYTNTTLTADPDLQLALAPNAIYEVVAHLSYSCGTSGVDLKFSFSIPTGAVGSYGDIYINTGAGVSIEEHAWTDVSAAQAISSNHTILMRGTIETSSAGTLALKGAQNTANAATVFLNQDSHLIARRIK